MNNLPDDSHNKSEIILYQTEDGKSRIEVKLHDETVWLSQKLMAELFQKDVRTINEHIKNAYAEGELRIDSTIRKFRIVQVEGKRQVTRLDTLNRIVNFYLEFAELQALNRKPMYMQDWISKLDDFLRLSERNILAHAGKISHEQAIEKTHEEYEKFRMDHLNAPSAVERHFAEAIKEVKRLEKEIKPQKMRKKCESE